MSLKRKSFHTNDEEEYSKEYLEDENEELEATNELLREDLLQTQQLLLQVLLERRIQEPLIVETIVQMVPLQPTTLIETSQTKWTL